MRNFSLKDWSLSMRDLIALSGKQYAGKDLLADLLLKELPEFRKSPLAGAIKSEFAYLYHLTPQDVEAEKSKYRTGLIALGQRRRQQEPDYWIRRVMMHTGPKIISDIRLQREYDFFKTRRALMIRVEADRDVRASRGTLTAENDPTECELDTVSGWDLVIVNNGSLEDLAAAVPNIVTLVTKG